MDKEPNYRWWI